jgi:hypothetical protein
MTGGPQMFGREPAHYPRSLAYTHHARAEEVLETSVTMLQQAI